MRLQSLLDSWLVLTISVIVQSIKLLAKQPVHPIANFQSFRIAQPLKTEL
jgi:hypothetical protein